MQELEKVLEEIEHTFKENIENIEDENGVHHFVIDSFTATFLAKEIIRKHMDNNNLCEKCSRRKWYQIGYKDGKNDGWIPVEERLPEMPKENPEFEGKKLELYLVTVRGTKYPFRAFWNGSDFTDGWTRCNVTAWCPLPDPYRPERGISIQQ